MNPMTRQACLWLAVTACGGCATWPGPSKSVDVADAREVRRERTIESFERRRDQAEYEAAVSRLERGERAAGIQMLNQVLTRNPGHLEARMLLADTRLVDDDLAGAERELAELMRYHPNNPQVHHSLGLVLESTGRRAEAAAAFARAVELEPANRLYRLSLEETGARSDAPP